MSKILIVDDVKANRVALASIIKHLDITIFYADSGNEALKLVLHQQFALILMDVNMPLMDGIETTALIHSDINRKNQPVVMVTALDRGSEELKKAYEAGAIDFITKPIEPTILIHKVAQFVELEVVREKAMEANKRLNVLLEFAGEGILGIDVLGQITFANPKAETILEKSSHELLNTSVISLMKSCTEKSLHWNNTTIGESLTAGVNMHSDCESWYRGDGSVISVEYSCESIVDDCKTVTGGVIIFQDITQRKRQEIQERYLAHHDGLTGLVNRSLSSYKSCNAIALGQIWP